VLFSRRDKSFLNLKFPKHKK